MKSSVFVRDVFYGMRFTSVVWGTIISCIALSWLVLAVVEYCGHERARESGLPRTLPVKMEAPVKVVGVISFSYGKNLMQLPIEFSGSVPMVLKGVIETSVPPRKKRKFIE